MPRVSREQTEINQQAITDASARLIREHGINGVSVSDLMGAAGLTHGGFYGHFDSKDALAAAACARAFEQSIRRWRQRVAAAAGPIDALQALVEGYLSLGSRDSPGTTCPTAALVNDVAREPANAPVRAAYVAGVQELVGILSSLQQTGSAECDRRQALQQLATLVGALALARATAGDPISEEIVAAGREMLVTGRRGQG
jgi:TetR/AcrR family transcriptional repressor of nem operon